jgi:sialate O-acetylesterase
MRGMLLAGMTAIGCGVQAAAPLLHPMFQDHAVLQRDRPIPVYGDAAPGATIDVSLGDSHVEAKAGSDGHWQARLPPLPAGGPYVLEAKSGDVAARASDVLIGDVFLCSGQSNMQFAVRGAANAALEMRFARDGQIRQLTIDTHDSLTPLATFATPVQWTVESPETVGNFSASCWFMARELKTTTKVPIGLVVSAWGGTRIRSWVSEKSLRGLPGLDAEVDMFTLYHTDPQASFRRWDAHWESWWRANGATAAHGNPWQPDYPVAGWKTAPEALGPWALWTGSSPDGFVGQMWLRTTVRLTAAQARQPAILDLGAVNEEDESWVNGHGVGGTSWSSHAQHVIPPGVLKAGDNVVVTNIFCSWRNCGMSGPATSRAIRFKDGTAALLSGPWRYAEVPDGLIAPQLPWGPTHGVAIDYNGMIAPIGPYAFRAAVWYQGESNVHFTQEYGPALEALMRDWRGQFGAGLPFLIVQLPNFGLPPTQPEASGLAEVREAQRRVASADPRAAYIVTIDIGDPGNIHPVNKQEVGRRLALAARNLLLGEKVAYNGPAPLSATRQADGVAVRFASTGALAGYSGFPNAFELCGATQDSCRWASARIEGADRVVVTGSNTASSTRVRYCWGESPICTLSDESRLPATPFEVPIQ